MNPTATELDVDCQEVIAAASSPNPSRVQDVLPPTLETSLARLRADLEAAKKFGPRT